MSKVKTLIIITASGLGLFVISYFSSIYYIPSYSMYPTLQPGDIVVAPTKDKLEPKHGSVWVFWGKDSADKAKGTRMVKRIVGLPNDTLCIKNGVLLINHQQITHLPILRGFVIPGLNPSLSIFPNDTSLIKWTVLNFGPLIVPGKGLKIDLSTKNLILYHQEIKQESPEMYRSLRILQQSGGDSTKKYTFQKNYYFCLGDNFLQSYDSRYWGLIPEENLIGRAKLVLFSCKKPKRFFIPL